MKTHQWIAFVFAFVLMFALSAIGADPSPSPIPVAPAQTIGFFAFMKMHWKDIAGPIFTLLFFVSEYMGLNPNVKSNGIFDFIRNWLKARAGIT